MNLTIRREALKAAAKVAMSLSAVAACGGSTYSAVDTETGAERSPEDETVSSDELRKKRDSGTATDASTAKKRDAATYGTDANEAAVAVLDLAQCKAKLDTVSPDAQSDWTDVLPASLTACCEVTIKDYEERTTRWDGGAWPEEKHRWGCCNLLNQLPTPPEYVGRACTPWGPPMPPSFDSAIVAEMFMREVA